MSSIWTKIDKLDKVLLEQTSQSRLFVQGGPMTNSPLRILVVEDDRTQQGLAIEQLEKQLGHKIELADHFHEARHLLETGQFDVVLTDLNFSLRNRCVGEENDENKERHPKPYGAVVAMHAATKGVKMVGILTINTPSHDGWSSKMAGATNLRMDSTRILGRIEEFDYRNDFQMKRWDLLLQDLLKD